MKSTQGMQCHCLVCAMQSGRTAASVASGRHSLSGAGSMGTHVGRKGREEGAVRCPAWGAAVSHARWDAQKMIA